MLNKGDNGIVMSKFIARPNTDRSIDEGVKVIRKERSVLAVCRVKP